VRFTFHGDEMILALVSLVREVDPRMLQQGPDGFTVDFAAIAQKTGQSEDEKLLLDFQAALAANPETAEERAIEMELTSAQGRRLAEALERLGQLQAWSGDVLTLSQGLRTRLLAIE